jgi:hypothetical protein
MIFKSWFLCATRLLLFNEIICSKRVTLGLYPVLLIDEMSCVVRRSSTRTCEYLRHTSYVTHQQQLF